MECKNCKYKKLCHDLELEGIIDLTCEEVAGIAESEGE